MDVIVRYEIELGRTNLVGFLTKQSAQNFINNFLTK